MEVCGGQTYSIVKYGLDPLLPENVEPVHGSGCPVCVTPLEMIDSAHAIARMPDVMVQAIGGEMGRILLVGCEPADLGGEVSSPGSGKTAFLDYCASVKFTTISVITSTGVPFKRVGRYFH